MDSHSTLHRATARSGRATPLSQGNGLVRNTPDPRPVDHVSCVSARLGHRLANVRVRSPVIAREGPDDEDSAGIGPRLMGLARGAGRGVLSGISAAGEFAGDYVGGTIDSYVGTARRFGRNISQVGEFAGATAEQVAAPAADYVRGMAGAAGEAMSPVADRVRGAVAPLQSSVTTASDRAIDWLADRTRRVGSGVLDMFRE